MSEIAERWRRPPNIIALDLATDHALDFEDGRLMVDVGVIADAETTERYRLGYLCLNCLWEPFEVPFPEHCHACGYEVRRCQERDFNRRFLGDTVIEPKVKVSEELERLQEILDYEERTGIELPDSVRYPNPGPEEL